jgi:uncharacterized protein (TIGR02611 family)
MLWNLKQQWRDIKTAKPGTRFQTRYHRRRNRRCSPFVKPFYLMFGAALFIAGLVLMPAPGPGLLVVFVGAGMLADESLAAARALDWVESKVHALVARAWRAWTRAPAGRR